MDYLYNDNKTEIFSFGGISTKSSRMIEVLKAAKIISRSNATVLIEGESGTGKEQIAKAIHEHSPRKNSSFIAVHAASFPETLLESELFGHEKGSFTGAFQQKRGRFELADKGSLFLDEIGELSPLLQVKLLRVIQERSFERLGGEQSLQIDTRVIAATNQNLYQMVQRKDFRGDLYYRLNVINLKMVPLRDRKEDLPLLCSEIIRKIANKENKNCYGFKRSFISKLEELSFPGNVRELENIIERAVIFSEKEILDKGDLHFLKDLAKENGEVNNSTKNLNQFNKEINLELILKTYHDCNGNKAKAARTLGLKESTYRYQLKKAFGE